MSPHDLREAAIAHMRVTGSVGCTYSEVAPDGTEQAVSVYRAVLPREHLQVHLTREHGIEGPFLEDTRDLQAIHDAKHLLGGTLTVPHEHV